MQDTHPRSVGLVATDRALHFSTGVHQRHMPPGGREVIAVPKGNKSGNSDPSDDQKQVGPVGFELTTKGL
jgi:hypothetical protein